MPLVTCSSCNAEIDLSKADVTGRGYRCATCSMKASLAADGGRNDVADHLTPEERTSRAKTAGIEMMLGAVVGVGGAGLFFAINGIAGMFVLCGGLGMASHGLLTRREMTGQRTG